MDFERFAELVHHNFNAMQRESKNLYLTNVDRDELWDLYLNSFPAGSNELYRVRRYYDCSCCRHFIKNVGGVVELVNGKIVTIWDGLDNPAYYPFDHVAKALSARLKSAEIIDIFVTDQSCIGTEHSHELVNGNVCTYDHFYVDIDSRASWRASTVSLIPIRQKMRSDHEAFYNSIKAISLGACETVLDLIEEKLLYRGDQYRSLVGRFIRVLEDSYAIVDDPIALDLYSWEHAREAGSDVCHIKGSLIGQLLVDISEGADLQKAVESYEKMAAPENYKRPKPVYSKRMLMDAKKTLTNLGYSSGLEREFATADDIHPMDMLWFKRDVTTIPDSLDDVFNELDKGVSSSSMTKNFKNLPRVNIQDFVEHVLPVANSLEVYADSSHEANFMSLLTSRNKDAKPMFKWGNNFSWAYNGDLTDSSIKRNVEKAGGNVHGDLRFSIQWNDGSEWNNCDYDAHMFGFDSYKQNIHVYFSHKSDARGKTSLDVDIINPEEHVPAVENIAVANASTLPIGEYVFCVDCYRRRSGNTGFSAEIEFNGQVYRYEYRIPLKESNFVKVAKIKWDGKKFEILENYLKPYVDSRVIWGVKMNSFVPVTAVCLSPNFWNGKEIGNKHYFFMLSGCKNPDTPSGIYNEYLCEELAPHRKVMEALGSAIKTPQNDSQLSGYGFSSTIRNELVVKVYGRYTDLIKVVF